MSNFLHDLKFAVRTLRRSPGYVIAALIVMALGIGANTSLFTVVDAVLLQPLPFGHPERLVRIWHTPPQSSFPGVKVFPVSAANYLDWEKQNQVFGGMAVFSSQALTLTGRGEPQSLPTSAVSRDYFSVLEAKPFLGRTFLREEDAPGKNHSVILSYAVWKNQFAENKDIVGQQITLNSESYDVVGVMGPEFRFPDWAKLWTPLGMTPKEAAVRGEHHYGVIARLKTSIDAKQAQAAMDTISQQLAQQYPADDKGWGAVIIPLREAIVGDVRPMLMVLMGAVSFVLLIACANVANLTLGRTLARSKEVAIRTALGAGRRRVIQQVMAESMLLALAGGAIGVALSHFGTELIVHVLSDKLPRFHEIHLNLAVLEFTLVVAVATGFAAGFLPAWRATKANPNDALKQGLGRTDGDGSPEKARNLLVVVEVALSLVLLFGAGLMIRTLWALHAVNPGFDPYQSIAMELRVPSTKFSTTQQQVEFFDRVLERIRQLPEVRNAGAIDGLPTQGGSMQPVGIEGRPVLAMADQPEVEVRTITPGYRDTLRIQLLRGRDFLPSDNANSHAVVMVSAAMAKRFWPNQEALGKHVSLTFLGDTPREIVGVVGDVKQNGLDSAEYDSTLYFPMAQLSSPAGALWHSFGMAIVARSASNPEALAPAIVRAIHEIDPELPVADVMTMNQLLGDAVAQQRFTMILLEAFSGLALVLAAVGIYSVLAYSVRRRMREIGIRVALGALPGHLLRMILLEGLRPTLLGVVVGIVSALGVGRLLTSVIFGVKSTDVLTFGIVSGVLVMVSVLASLLPGYRAMRVDPMRTLRDE